jgi:thiamine-phosphate pyrophosphorylase
VPTAGLSFRRKFARSQPSGYSLGKFVKRTLTDARLYGILDLNYIDLSQIVPVAHAMVEGQVDVIQLRAKEKSVDEIADAAAGLHEITSCSSIPLIVNDYPEVATRVPVEGVHVGQDDDPIPVARKKAGREIIVGRSTHSLEQAIAAQAEGADYIGFGPIFTTPTKPDYKPVGMEQIKALHIKVTLPIFCIGGIKLDNLEKLIAAGAQRVAIVSGLLKAADIAEYARACKKLLTADL